MNVDNTEEIRCLSLCSGYGGLELGLKRACPDVRTVAYVEVEAFACANLVAKIEAGMLDAAPVWTDIKTFDAAPFRDRIHIITAGYPCQPFSCAGRREGEKDPRHLWPDIKRVIEAVRPVWFFGENVAGHLSPGFADVYRGLHDLGYATEAGLFSASECGAPHRRCRLFVLAHDECRWAAQQERGEQKQRQWFIDGSQTMAHIEYSGQGPGIIKETSAEIRRYRFAEQCSVVADTTTFRIQGSKPERTTPARRQIDKQSYADHWPARPGQPQYEWEEPRTLGNPDRPGQEGNSGRSEQKPVKRFKYEKSQAQSGVGRATDGVRCRVDRLRLLGNGVVPQQAEKAFRYLMNKF